MPSITSISGLSSGFAIEYQNVRTLELRGPVFGGGAFGDAYDLVTVNGAPPSSPQIVKVLRDNGFDSALGGLETIQKLQRKIIADNRDRQAAGSPAIQTLPALRALPQLSFRGQISDQPVLGYSANRLDTAGYVSLAQILDPDDDPEPRRRYVTQLALEDRLRLAYELAEGVQALRKLSYIHGDINPPNLFVNIGTGHLALIDFDSGAVTDSPDDVPTTFGKKVTDAEWLAPEIIDQILAHRSGPIAIHIDRFTDDWAVTVGIHYLLFLCGPFFVLQRSSSKQIRDYVTRYRWPGFDAADPLFAPWIEDHHANYSAMLGELPSPVLKRMWDALNRGAMEPRRRASTYQWMVDLGGSHETLEIILFQADSQSVARAQRVRLEWKVTGADRVSIDNGVGDVDLEGRTDVFPTRNQRYILTAVGRGTSKHAAVSVHVNSVPDKSDAPSRAPGPLRIFISYSHEDRRWIERIRVHLKPLAREYNLDVWDDGRISAGSAWQEEIEQAIDTAGAAVLLVSADFLASDFVHEVELPKLLEKAEQHGTLILPLIVSACRYTETPWLQKLQCVNDPKKPVDMLLKGEQEQTFLDLVRELERRLRKPGIR